MASRITVLLSVLALFLTSILGGRAWAQPATKPAEPVRRLDSLAVPNRWRPSAMTLDIAKLPLATRRPTLHVHIDVDHENPVDQPIGWPRMYLNFKREEMKWAEFDRFEFQVLGRSTRPERKSMSASFQVMCPNKSTGADVSIQIPKLETWTRVSIPIKSIRRLDKLGSLLFYIAEKQYEHGEKLDFFLGDFRLVGAASPAQVDASKPELLGQPSPTALVKKASGPVRVNVPVNLAEGEQKEAHLRWKATNIGGKTVGSGFASVDGARVGLLLDCKDWQAGRYQLDLVLEADGKELDSRKTSILITESPFAE